MDWTWFWIAFAALAVASYATGLVRGLRPFWPLLRRIRQDVRSARAIHRANRAIEAAHRAVGDRDDH